MQGKTMKKIFVCSPYRGDISKNRAAAMGHCMEIIRHGDMPLAPHLYFTQFLVEENPKDREKGISMGLELMLHCDRMHVYGTPTEGMKREIAHWKRCRNEKYILYFEEM